MIHALHHLVDLELYAALVVPAHLVSANLDCAETRIQDADQNVLQTPIVHRPVLVSAPNVATPVPALVA